MKIQIFIISLAFLVFTSCKEDNIDWVFVDGGTFEQGKNQIIITPKGDTINGFTSPNRMVELDDFYISKYEITVKQFREFCENTSRKMPEAPIENAHGVKVYYKWIDENPMLATWDEANEYAKWAGGRLPTEAEWEYAAKGGKKTKNYKYSGSNNPIEIGWVKENSDGIFHKVGLLKPNELGIYDMTGNVGEWVSDWYNPEKDSLVSKKNPQGPTEGEGSYKISKGVSWFYETQGADGKPLEYGIHMPEVRYQSPISTRNDGFGFRIAKNK
ncbi:formylglycine-generating enzyme family protein [Flavobacterium branchiicola]|uniref:Formylglycine-generating enzyme family protein n=1 Tax=Flavobacterium branchiicola TaxID=1114875 RepID=A0ABV9P9Y2_9FLAO|nr:SUMF1/EgtB/PvdO family nonheme iron enzyme [Flavobacterium branchiicola]MBS7252446.1 SUMF1/EgtB/PvdO family nonheme iron enzyme [Flavobacterium branchiicola]